MNILITGGASGLGEAITRKLAKDPKNIIYFTFNSSLLNAKLIESEFKNTVAVKCDFKNLEEINLLQKIIETIDLDVLINNAYSGNPIKNYFHKSDLNDFISEFNINITPTILITQSAIRKFRKRKGGKIITILTSFLHSTQPIGSSSYVAGKAYLKSLAKSWSTENIKFNITSNSISPSFMQTNLTTDVDGRIIEKMIEDHPLKSLLKVEEVAETVSFLTKVSLQVNGIDIIINAGTHV